MKIESYILWKEWLRETGLSRCMFNHVDLKAAGNRKGLAEREILGSAEAMWFTSQKTGVDVRSGRRDDFQWRMMVPGQETHWLFAAAAKGRRVGFAESFWKDVFTYLEGRGIKWRWEEGGIGGRYLLMEGFECTFSKKSSFQQPLVLPSWGNSRLLAEV